MSSAIGRRNRLGVLAVLSAVIFIYWTRSLNKDSQLSRQGGSINPSNYALQGTRRTTGNSAIHSAPAETYKKVMTVRGMVFSHQTKMGEMDGEVSSVLDTSVVKSFSPDVVNHVKDIFFDEYNECQFFATVPAMLRIGDTIKVIQRIWLGQYERMMHRLKKEGRPVSEMANRWRNSWQENYLYEIDLDHDYTALGPGRIMGLPTTTNTRSTYKSDGPMHPRLSRVGDKELLSFHTWLTDPSYNNASAGRMHIYDINSHFKRKLKTGRKMPRTEINWIPLDVEGQLHMTYSLDPLRVLKCELDSGECAFIFEQLGSEKNPFEYSVDHLRGGTPWVLYRYPYYISMGHSVTVAKSPATYSLYNSHLIVLCVDPWRVVYVSRHLDFNSDWLNSQPLIRNHTIGSSFFYPSGLIKWSDDIIDISGHLNDYGGHVIRINGVKELMDNVIGKDGLNKNSTGPSVRTVQQYVMEDLKVARPQHGFYGDLRAPKPSG